MTSGGESRSDQLTEGFTLNFVKVKVEYMEQGEDGTGTAWPEISQNIAIKVSA